MSLRNKPNNIKYGIGIAGQRLQIMSVCLRKLKLDLASSKNEFVYFNTEKIREQFDTILKTNSLSLMAS